MELIAERGRRISVEELNTTKLLAHARQQAVQRKYDEMLIVDCDAHHYENESYDEILPFMENDVLRQLTIGGRGFGRRAIVPSQAGFTQDMGGRVTRYPMRPSEKTEFRPDARHPARRALDGCHGRRLFVPVPDRDAQYRSASAEGDGERAVLGLQSLAHGEGAARSARPHVLHAVPAVLRSGRSPCATWKPSATARASPASW